MESSRGEPRCNLLHKSLSHWMQIRKRQRFSLHRDRLTCIRPWGHHDNYGRPSSLNKPYPVPTIWRSLSCPPRSSNVQSSNARYYGCKRLALVNNMAGCSQVATNGNGDPEPTALMKSVCLRCSRRSQEQGRISMVKYRNRREKKGPIQTTSK